MKSVPNYVKLEANELLIVNFPLLKSVPNKLTMDDGQFVVVEVFE